LDGLRPTVVWDVDDVLNDLTSSWLAHAWAPSHPDAPIAYADLRANPPHEALGIALGDYQASLDRFRLGDALAALRPNPLILAWLEGNGERCRHVALTATAFRAAPTSAAWVLGHFGRWIREFAFVPAARPGEDLPQFDHDKGEWIARLPGPVALVDDSLGNLAAATAVGAAAVRWPQPWNGGASRPEDALAQLSGWLARQEAA
jgi:hypothetical protein